MTLNYWVANCLNDNEAYSLRRKTKKEIMTYFAENGFKLRKVGDELQYCNEDFSNRFSIPHKVQVQYSDGFDLLSQCLGEGGIYEGNL